MGGSLTLSSSYASQAVPPISSTISDWSSVFNVSPATLWWTKLLKFARHVLLTAHPAHRTASQSKCSAQTAPQDMRSSPLKRHAGKAATAHNITALARVSACPACLGNILIHHRRLACPAPQIVPTVSSIVKLILTSVFLAKMDLF